MLLLRYIPTHPHIQCFVRPFASSTYHLGQTSVEKIVQRYTIGLQPGQRVQQGDFVYIQPHHILTHDNSGAVIDKFTSIGATKISNPRQPVFVLDHDVQNMSETNQNKYKAIEQFAKRFGIDFYPAGSGIGHQVMCEQGYAFPYTLTVGSDSHSNMYGGIGCLGTPVVRTDACAIWCTSQTWWQVPKVVKVFLSGQLLPGVTGKDVILAMCAHFNKNQVLNTAIEFHGPGIECLSINDRLSIANMTTEWGALTGLFPVDSKTMDWLKKMSTRDHPRLNPTYIEKIEKTMHSGEFEPDSDAVYTKSLQFNLSELQPYVSGPNSVKIAHPISELAKKSIKIDKAYLVSCVNSRVDDIYAAAQVVRHAIAQNKHARVAKDVEFYIAPASALVLEESKLRGDWQVLLDAGAIPLPAGCGPCVGLGLGLLKDGDVGISATNRNFKGRMGSPNAQAYLASPAIVAASALSGKICVPDLPEFQSLCHSESPLVVLTGTETTFKGSPSLAPPTNTSTSELNPHKNPQSGLVSGELLFVHQDNLNTDGIYPGKYTYQDKLSPAQMAECVMENYDLQFRTLVKQGTILLTGFNFGTGSSREQAATALMASGVQLILTGSASETFKRNALNNGLLVLEVPELVRDAQMAFGTERLTVPTGWKCDVDLDGGKIVVTGASQKRTYLISKVGSAAQELVRDHGLENWIKRKIVSSIQK